MIEIDHKFLGEDGEGKPEDPTKRCAIRYHASFRWARSVFLPGEATCGNRDHKNAEKTCRLTRTAKLSDVPGREHAGRPLGTTPARLRRSVAHGDVSCWSDQTKPCLLATFSHEERLALVVGFLRIRPGLLALLEQQRPQRPSVEVSWP